MFVQCSGLNLRPVNEAETRAFHFLECRFPFCAFESLALCSSVNLIPFVEKCFPLRTASYALSLLVPQARFSSLLLLGSSSRCLASVCPFRFDPYGVGGGPLNVRST